MTVLNIGPTVEPKMLELSSKRPQILLQLHQGTFQRKKLIISGLVTNDFEK